MSFNAQFERLLLAIPPFRQRSFVLVSALVFVAASAHGQQLTPVVGHIEGDAVSIALSASAVSVPPDPASRGEIVNGGVVTVRSGQARLMLTAGGEIDICGPAQMTLLQTNDAITVALEFGTLRLQLPESTNVRVFTPMIIATPVEINAVPSDVTVMLQQDDSLCVRAASGALLLESQFTNEKIVVPQTGQFWFEQGRLVPVARTDVNCQCVLPEARLVPAPSPANPATGEMVPAEIVSAAKRSLDAKRESEQQADESGVEYSILARPNEAHPTAPASKAVPGRAPELKPFYRVDMPPLAFSASSPAPPSASAEQMIVLIRTTQIDPYFEFTGHVDAPPIEQKSEKRSAEKSRAGQSKIAGSNRGFWGKVKRFFVGSSS